MCVPVCDVAQAGRHTGIKLLTHHNTKLNPMGNTTPNNTHKHRVLTESTESDSVSGILYSFRAQRIIKYSAAMYCQHYSVISQ